MRNCAVCGIDITDKKETAKTCSPKCRKELSRLESVTPNVTLGDQIVTPEIYFEFYTETVGRKTDLGNTPSEKHSIRKAKYWYDVPIAAIPVIKKGWPTKPDYINGRQYFLWWKNNFEMGKGESPFDGPILWNPFK